MPGWMKRFSKLIIFCDIFLFSISIYNMSDNSDKVITLDTDADVPDFGDEAAAEAATPTAEGMDIAEGMDTAAATATPTAEGAGVGAVAEEAAAAAEPATAEGAAAEMKTRRALINDIIAYKNSRLGRFITIMPPSAVLLSMSSLELSALLEEMRSTVSAARNAKNIEKAFHWAAAGIEHFACANTPARLEGFAKLVTSDDDILDDVAEIAYQYRNLSSMTPEARLGLNLLGAAVNVHAVNSRIAAMKAGDLGAAVPPEKVAQYADL